MYSFGNVPHELLILISRNRFQQETRGKYKKRKLMHDVSPAPIYPGTCLRLGIGVIIRLQLSHFFRRER